MPIILFRSINYKQEDTQVNQAFQPSKIAIIQTAFIGDVVFTSPLCRALKCAYPDASLTFVCTPRALDVARALPGIDRAIAFDKRGEHCGFWGLRRIANALNGPDLVIVPHLSPRSALLAFLSRKSRKNMQMRIGWSSGPLRPLFTHPVVKDRSLSFVRRTLACLRPLGMEGETPLSLTAPFVEIEKARAISKIDQGIGLIIGSERVTKRWPADLFAQLADAIVQRGQTPVFLGAPNEKIIAEEIFATMKHTQSAINLVGNTIAESMGVISCLRGVVGGDSGLTHIARALNRPTVVLFGPTSPAMHDWEIQARPISLGLDCQPCHRHGPKQCPRGDLRCMRLLDIQLVINALESLGTLCDG